MLLLIVTNHHLMSHYYVNVNAGVTGLEDPCNITTIILATRCFGEEPCSFVITTMKELYIIFGTILDHSAVMISVMISAQKTITRGVTFSHLEMNEIVSIS